jgi:hypothetical protein
MEFNSKKLLRLEVPTYFPEQLMRFLMELTRFPKVSTGFPEVAMRPPKFGAWNPKEAGGLGWFR